MRLKWLPNAISIVRLCLVFPFLLFIYREEYILVLQLVVVIALLDIVDGMLARRLNAVTKLGTILDPMADKIALAFGFAMLAIVGAVPIWFAALVFLRDLIISLGSWLYYRIRGPFRVQPVVLGKLNTLILFTYCSFVIAQRADWLVMDEWVYEVMLLLSTLIIIASVVQYLYLGVREKLVGDAGNGP